MAVNHMPDTIALSTVLPCYNEADGLEAILKRFEAVRTDIPFELLLVDNGSTDHTGDVLRKLLPRYPFACSVRVERNQGYGHGLLTGLQAAHGEVLSWTHADLQTDPADVFRAYERLMAASREERVLVKGKRSGRSLGDRIISMGMQVLASVLCRCRLHEINAQPKVFRRELMALLTNPPDDFSFDLYVLVVAKRNGYRFESVPVEFPPRQYGESNWAATWRSKIRTIAQSIRYMLHLSVCGKEDL